MQTIVSPIGIVHSLLKNIKDCPLQENEDAPKVTIEIFEKYREAISDIHEGDWLIVLTWLHLADRGVLKTKPRNDKAAALTGVFSTRSPDRPNPIGIHLTEVVSVSIAEITVSSLEVLDQTPVIDIKPALMMGVLSK